MFCKDAVFTSSLSGFIQSLKWRCAEPFSPLDSVSLRSSPPWFNYWCNVMCFFFFFVLLLCSSFTLHHSDTCHKLCFNGAVPQRWEEMCSDLTRAGLNSGSKSESSFSLTVIVNYCAPRAYLHFHTEKRGQYLLRTCAFLVFTLKYMNAGNIKVSRCQCWDSKVYKVIKTKLSYVRGSNLSNKTGRAHNIWLLMFYGKYKSLRIKKINESWKCE